MDVLGVTIRPVDAVVVLVNFDALIAHGLLLPLEVIADIIMPGLLDVVSFFEVGWSPLRRHAQAWFHPHLPIVVEETRVETMRVLGLLAICLTMVVVLMLVELLSISIVLTKSWRVVGEDARGL